MTKHLYRYGGKAKGMLNFENRYGEKKGKKIYGAVVGKIAREREAEKEAIRRDLENPRISSDLKQILRNRLRALDTK